MTRRFLRQQHRLRSRSAFSLLEMLTAVAILGIVTAMMWSVLMINWDSSENYIARADLWHEMDSIVDAMTSTARQANLIDVQTSESSKTALMTDIQGDRVLYRIDVNGTFSIARDGADDEDIISRRMDFETSEFSKSQNSLNVTLVMTDDHFGKPIRVHSSTEIYPRNINYQVPGAS